MVYACNICDEGYDSIKEVNKHISHDHEDILSHIMKKAMNERDDDKTKNTDEIFVKASVETNKIMLKSKLCGKSIKVWMALVKYKNTILKSIMQI